MKSYIPFVIAGCISLGVCLCHTIKSNDCLFTFQNRCYTCHDETFFVGTPEGCTICPNKQARYVDWDGKSIWACLNTPVLEENEIEFQEVISDIPCTKQSPVRDILGHCYTCQAIEAIQISNNGINVCQGKRYLTHYRGSKKSNLCPHLNQIQDPYVCVACQGQWQNEKCVPISLKSMNFCLKNSDCPNGQWCDPFHYPTYSKSGICRPMNPQKWICSKMDGYTYESAEIFCTRQNAHLPTFSELENEKEATLSACPQTNIWTIFDEGSLYLDSLKTPFPITKEKESFELGGDNTHALCIQN